MILAILPLASAAAAFTVAVFSVVVAIKGALAIRGNASEAQCQALVGKGRR